MWDMFGTLVASINRDGLRGIVATTLRNFIGFFCKCYKNELTTFCMFVAFSSLPVQSVREGS